MRTTITLDDDVARKLRAVVHELRRPFRQVVNEFLRLGLNARQSMGKQTAFRVRPKRLGQVRGRQYDNIAALLEDIEGPEHS